MQFYQFETPCVLVQELVTRIKIILNEAIYNRGEAYLVVSGGKTPISLFQALSQCNLDWEKITVTLVDERCVSIDNEDRNEILVRNYLLKNLALKASFIALYDEHPFSIKRIERKIAALPTFDVVILGMGTDGHTASLFPCAPELSQGLTEDAKAVLTLQPATASYKRISLSKPRLLNSRHIFLHLNGVSKLKVLQRALRNPDPIKMPISAFLNNSYPNLQVMYAP